MRKTMKPIQLLWCAVLCISGTVYGKKDYLYEGQESRRKTICSDTCSQKKGCCVTICCESDDDQTPQCAMTPIVETGFSQTITQPGSYCLATDLEHELIIASSSVTVYMKGHVIYVPVESVGVRVTALVTDFRLMGGAIDGQEGGNVGISVLGASDVRIEDVSCVRCEAGILLNPSSMNAMLARVHCRGNVTGLVCQHDVGTVVVDSSFNENGVGVIVNGSTSFVMQRCMANESSAGDGVNGHELASCQFLDCTAQNNNGGGFVFVNSCADIVVRQSVANSNGVSGFVISDNSSDVVLLGCAAENNIGAGIEIDLAEVVCIDCVTSSNEGDGTTASNSTVLVRGCVANNNNGYGFNTDTVSNQFYSTVACGNGMGQYNNVTSAPVTSAYNMRGVQNVDCQNNTPDVLDEILDRVESGFGCSVTVLSVDEPITLTVPGRYCLATDFTNQITISSDSITLDLNDHTITVSGGSLGVAISGGFNDVRIKNGFIVGDGMASAGISVGAAADILISDITCSNFLIGLDIDGAQRVKMNRIVTHQNTVYGIHCFNSFDVVVSQCQCDMSSVGIIFDGSQRFCVRECTVANNNVGISVFAGSMNGEIVHCFANTNVTAGFEVDTSSYIVIRECAVCGTGLASTSRGYAIIDGLVFVVNSVASACGTGFFVGAVLNNAVVIRECSAYGNNVGFENNAPLPCFFYANDACNNGTNFIGVTSAPVSGGDCSTYWNNVDCTVVCP